MATITTTKSDKEALANALTTQLGNRLRASKPLSPVLHLALHALKVHAHQCVSPAVHAPFLSQLVSSRPQSMPFVPAGTPWSLSQLKCHQRSLLVLNIPRSSPHVLVCLHWPCFLSDINVSFIMVVVCPHSSLFIPGQHISQPLVSAYSRSSSFAPILVPVFFSIVPTSPSSSCFVPVHPRSYPPVSSTATT